MLLLCSPHLQADSKRDQAVELVKNARVAWKKYGDYGKMLQRCNEAIRIDPRYWRAYAYRAVAYEEFFSKKNDRQFCLKAQEDYKSYQRYALAIDVDQQFVRDRLKVLSELCKERPATDSPKPEPPVANDPPPITVEIPPKPSSFDYCAMTPRPAIAAHNNTIDAIAYARSGSTLATGSWVRTKYGTVGEIKLWDDKGTPKATLTGHVASVHALAFSPDGKTLLSGAWDQSVLLWNIAGRREQKLATAHDAPIIKVGFSPDGSRFYSADQSGVVVIWNSQSHQVQTILRLPQQDKIRDCDIAWDKGLIATGGADQTLRLWKLDGGAPVREMKKPGAIAALAFSPDGERIASANWLSIWIWNVESGEVERSLSGHEQGVVALAFSPDGKFTASGDSNGKILIGDAGTSKTCEKTREPRLKITALVFAPLGGFAAAADTGGAKDKGILVLWK
jgi:hypothetical protein